MISALAHLRAFNRPVRLLMVGQLAINIGFYMLMPFLAAYLSGRLGLSAAVVGLVLGVRTLSQQGLFVLGGVLADRVGCKPLVVAGCATRSVGFALLGVAHGLPALVAASALTGFAGALFNPAVRAYLAAEAGPRRVEAFAAFNVFYQVGILVGPLVGLALQAVSFGLVCAVAATLFAGLTVVQWRALPTRSHAGATAETPPGGMGRWWRTPVRDRSFGLLCVAMTGSYVLSFQIYLALPLQVHAATGRQNGTAALFMVSGLLAALGQVRVTRWCQNRYTCGQAMTRGLAVMAAAFTPLIAFGPMPGRGTAGPAALALLPVLVTTALLTLGTLITYPFEMDTVVGLAAPGMTGTYYGMYSTITGIGITLGNLAVGALWDTARADHLPALPWAALTGVGATGALGVHALARAGRLQPAPTRQAPAPTA